MKQEELINLIKANPMQNLKINGLPTPYWCVVVPIDYDAKLSNRLPPSLLQINEIDKLVFELLGCITLSSMDEGVREVVESIEEYNGVWAWKDYAHESALSLLQHNQITLTPYTKAVVVKQKYKRRNFRQNSQRMHN